jgi:hypothetical protein
MKKVIFTIMIALFATVGQVKADLPFIPSTDTGAGAHWYYLFYESAWGLRMLWVNPVNLDQPGGILWGNIAPQDANQFCFIGNESEGFDIYTRAYLTGANVNDEPLEKDFSINYKHRVQDDGWEYDAWGVFKTGGTSVKWKIEYDGNKISIADDRGFGWDLNGGSSATLNTWGANPNLVAIPEGYIDEYTYTLTPLSGAKNVAPNTPITIAFNKEVGYGNVQPPYAKEGSFLYIHPSSVVDDTDVYLSLSEDRKTITVNYAYPAQLAPNKEYTVKLKNIIAPSVIGHGDADPQITWKFTTGTGETGLADVKASTIAYASGNEVFVNAAGKEKTTVYSSNGAIVKQTADTHFTLNSGFYIVKVGTERVKVVVR